MARVTKSESYATESKIEILSQAKLSAQEEASNAQSTLTKQEIVVNKNDVKASIDLANGKKVDDQLQATLLKSQLQDTASRLDKFREGDLKGFEKEAKKFSIEDLGVIKDNLGKEIVKKQGPGIDAMYKKGEKYEMPDRDPLKGLPKTEKQEKDAKKAPDMPFKDDPSLASGDINCKIWPGKWSYCWEIDPSPQQPGVNHIGGKNPAKPDDNDDKKKQDGIHSGKHSMVDREHVKDHVATHTGPQKDHTKTGYMDPDQVDATKVEKPKDPPPTDHDLIGHKVNPLHHDPIIDTENVDVKKVIAEHKGLKKTQIYVDPDQVQKKTKFDAANPPRIEENELKNTGNPHDFNGVQWELPKGGGDKPHTDGEGGNDGKDSLPGFKTATGAGGNQDTVKGVGGSFGPVDDDEEDDPYPNVPK